MLVVFLIKIINMLILQVLRTDATIDDVCYTSKSGEKVCLENDKLQKRPTILS